MIGPVLSRQTLEEHDDGLKVHPQQLFAPAMQEYSAHEWMKFGKRVGAFGQVCVPDADDTLYTHFAHEQAVHPAERELHVLNTLLGQVLVKWRIDALDYVGHNAQLPQNPWLRKDVIVLNAIEQLRHAPERIGLEGLAHVKG